jgi:NTP pyrophosphatase (non-canonical NTP hydrolase)
MTLDLDTLRRANMARQAEWPGAGAVDLAFRGLELAGEVGELEDAVVDMVAVSAATGRVCNLAKKLVRIRRDIHGTSETAEHLLRAMQDEAADVLISLDLLCMDLGIDLSIAAAAKFNETSIKKGLLTRLPA